MEQENLDDFWGNAFDPLVMKETMFFHLEFESMRGYAEAVENLLIEHAEKTSKNIPIPNNKMTKEEIDYFYAEYDVDIYEIKRAFPKILRHSLFVYSYSFIERALLHLAEDYRRDSLPDTFFLLNEHMESHRNP